MYIESESHDSEIIDELQLVIVVELDDEVLEKYEVAHIRLDIEVMVELERVVVYLELVVGMLEVEVELLNTLVELDELVDDELEQLEVLLDVQLHTIDDEVDDEDELADELDVSEYLSLDIKQLADITFLDELVILAEITQYTALLQMVL